MSHWQCQSERLPKPWATEHGYRKRRYNTSDEVLFQARISPTRFVNTLSGEEVEYLYAAIQEVLRNAIEVIRTRAGDRPFTKEIRDFLRVYNRAGQPCPVCGKEIAEVHRAQTRTYYCPTCQAGGKSLPDRRSWLRR